MKFLKQLLKKWNVTETHGPPIGIYNVAGGNVGIGKALEAHNLLGKTVFIGHEINPNSRMLLESDHMDIVISHDVEHEVALSKIASLCISADNRYPTSPRQKYVSSPSTIAPEAFRRVG